MKTPPILTNSLEKYCAPALTVNDNSLSRRKIAGFDKFARIFSISLLMMLGVVGLKAQSCTGVPIVNWPINNCAAFGNANDYSEFTPTYPNAGGCGTTSATNIFRNNGSHSCNPGPANGDGVAFCVGGFDSPGYVANSPSAIRLRVSFGAGDMGQLTGFDFLQNATNPTQFINHVPWNNNYPTQFGLRVIKNGTEIFRQTGLSTDTSWTAETFDFSSNNAFAYAGTTTFEFELFAYDPVGNGYSKYIWDVDNFTVSGCCNTCDNVTSPGAIAGNQNSCGAFDPDPISSVSLPAGGSGTIEYIWLENSSPSLNGATPIAGATGPTYDPGPITTTTYYRRCARRSGCSSYVGESNWICMEVDPGPSVSCSGTDITCFGDNNGTASVTVTGGTSTTTLVWSNGATTPTISGLAAGTYTVVASDTGSCSDTCSVVIAEPTDLNLVTTATPVSCNAGNDGSATATAIGGTPPYSYAWSNGGTSATLTGLTAGTYTVSVTDANNCQQAGSVTITEPTAIQLTVSGVDPLCNGDANGSASVSATGGTGAYSIVWSNGATTAALSNLAAGTYSVTVTDANGCSANGSVVLTDPAQLQVNPIGTDPTCHLSMDGSVSANATGGTTPYSYVWSTGATTASISNLGDGAYSVTVTDANGCTATGSTTLNEPAPLMVTVTTTDASCSSANDGSATVSASGGTAPYSYTWSTGATTATISGLAAGSYDVTVEDANGCVDVQTATVQAPAPIAVTVAGSDVTCNGAGDGSATATASGGTAPYSYLWSDGQTTATATGLGAGTLTVSVTDANGCSGAGSVTITEPTALAVAANGTDVSCNGGTDGSATATATGGTAPYSYLWSDGQTTATATGLNAGTYTVTATDANGCAASATVSLTEPTALTVTTAATDVNCAGAGDGTATATASGGTAPYTYLWSDGQTAATATGLAPGSYSVTVTDANGCSAGGSVSINEPTSVVVTASATPDSCNVGVGTATASASGGTAPYSYLWSDGQTTATATGLVAGNYDVTVTDANTCSATATVVVETNVSTDTCTVGPGDFRTQTQGGWGSNCNGNNPGCYRDANFAAAFPNGLTIGCNFTLTLTSSAAVQNYLPCGGPSAVLTQNYVDPTSCTGGVVVSQLIAATLSTQFDLTDPNFGGSSTNLIDLVIASGPMAGLTVGDVLTEANNAIGGCGSTYSLNQINQTLTSINENFVDGTSAGNDLECPDPCGTANAPIAAPKQIGGAVAWPNPTESTVNVEFTVINAGETQAAIFNTTSGQTVESMDLGYLQAGRHFFTWDGADYNGNMLSKGLYLIRIKVKDQVETVKVIRQ